MGDMMEDNAALNRRPNLPTMIAPARPQKQAKQTRCETITAQEKTNEPLQEQQITRTIKEYADQRRKRKTEQPNRCAKETKRIQDRTHTENRGNEQKETETAAFPETYRGNPPPSTDRAYRKVDTWAIAIDTRIRHPLEEEE